MQKRRNQSRQIVVENKFFLKGQYSNMFQFNSQNANQGQQKTLNRLLAHSETEENLARKKNSMTPYKFHEKISNIQDKFASFSYYKIKNLLKNETSEEEKQNVPKNQYKTINPNYHQYSSKPNLMRYSGTMIKTEQKCDKQNEVPYFIESLKKKNYICTETCMHIHNSIHIFQQYLKSALNVKPRLPNLAIPDEIFNRKTIVFDMDETLIHTNELMVKGYQLKVPFKTIQGRVINGYVHVRPYARQIIKKLSKDFDIIIFTAGNQCYADPILDYLDPQRCVKFRLYRQSCTLINNQIFVKDLRILGRRLENVVLVDNAPYSYMMQLANGIPILNYIKGKDDTQLIKLQGYLMSLLHLDDVRIRNKETFKLQEYIHYDKYEKLIQELYAKWL